MNPYRSTVLWVPYACSAKAKSVSQSHKGPTTIFPVLKCETFPETVPMPVENTERKVRSQDIICYLERNRSDLTKRDAWHSSASSIVRIKCPCIPLWLALDKEYGLLYLMSGVKITSPKKYVGYPRTGHPRLNLSPRNASCSHKQLTEFEHESTVMRTR